MMCAVSCCAEHPLLRWIFGRVTAHAVVDQAYGDNTQGNYAQQSKRTVECVGYCVRNLEFVTVVGHVEPNRDDDHQQYLGLTI